MAQYTITAPPDLFSSDPENELGWTLVRLTSSRAVYESGDYRLELSGRGFAAGSPPGGTISGMTLIGLDETLAGGESVLMHSTGGLSMSLAGLADAMANSPYLFAALPYLFQGNDTLTGSARSDGLTGYAGADVLRGGDGNDLLRGDSPLIDDALHGNDTLDGGAGSDTLDGGGGADRMTGGTGSDLYVVDNPDDVVIEAAGGGTRDRVQLEADASWHRYTLPDQVENLEIEHYTDDGATLLRAIGNGLDNKITVAARYGSSPGEERLYGGGGDDRLYAGDGDDWLVGGTGNDTMIGGTGADRYVVDSLGDRVLESISLSGRDGGPDRVVVDGLAKAAVFSLGGTVRGLSRDAIYLHVEQLEFASGTADHTGIGNEAANLLVGNAGDNRLEGLDGNDTLNGGSGNDLLRGGSGRDTLVGSRGNDRLDGGSGIDNLSGGKGNDTYVIDTARDQVHELADQGTDLVIVSAASRAAVYSLGSTVSGLKATVTWSQVEQIDLGSGTLDHDAIGSSAANALYGNRGDNQLYGGRGNDVLQGRGGSDRLYGEQGDDRLTGDTGRDRLDGGTGHDRLDGGDNNDTLIGSKGNDQLVGGSGNDRLDGGSDDDRLTGGLGSDTLTGGSGADRFVWSSTKETSTGNGRDHITDFDASDRIDLRGIDADTARSGDQAFTYIGSQPFSDNATGQLRFDGRTLWGSTDADTAPEFSIGLQGFTALTRGDFLL